MSLTAWVFVCLLSCLFLSCTQGGQSSASVAAPFINTWLVLGTFDNDEKNTGYNHDWIGEATVQPFDGMESSGKVWRYFDDRLFSRNYDDYQDLFSYFKIKRNESIAAKVAYAHIYIYTGHSQTAQLRIGADNEFKAWINGGFVASSTQSNPHRDKVKVDVELKSGWNRLLLKIANQENGRFGFYARLCDANGNRLPNLTYSVNGGRGPLAVATKPMTDVHTGSLPVAFRDWPYVGANPFRDPDSEMEGYLLRKPHLAMHASDFFLNAQGGEPPYRWSLAKGRLPQGIKVNEDGAMTGTVTASSRPGEYPLEVKVVDRKGDTATKTLSLTVKERPNKWYEEARLVALMHNPESILNATDSDLTEFARLMKRQGYALGMMISYNNGDFKYRWPSMYEPNNPLGDLAVRYKAALESEGIRFGMYMGNLIGPNHGGDNGAILMVEEAVRRYRPAAFWFDWASPDPDGYVSLDALYSMIRTLSPETLIVLNGVGTLYQGDWDVICLEGWGAWGKNIWATWPFPIRWPKRCPVETWRMLADPTFEYSKDIHPEWQEYLRVQLSIIGQGFVANIDHSPTIHTPYKTLYESVVMQAHRKMADWANPPGIPSLTESYTKVNPGPLAGAPWGYHTINLSRDVIYLHILSNPFGKSGKPDAPTIAVGPVKQKVKRVVWMNRNSALHFEQRGTDLNIRLKDVIADPVDTILKIELDGPHPTQVSARAAEEKPVPPGNLATHKPARLLSADGTHALIPSAFAFARYGVDGILETHAQGAYEWAWTYHVDLLKLYPVRRVVIRFVRGGYATEYNLLLSGDGLEWHTVAHVTGCKGGGQEHSFAPVQARYVRVQAVKPDGPNQEGAQMGIAELEVYAQ